MRPIRRRRLGGLALSLVIHLGLLGVLLWPAPKTGSRAAPGAHVVPINLVGDPDLAPAGTSPSTLGTGTEKPPPPPPPPPVARSAPAPRPAENTRPRSDSARAHPPSTATRENRRGISSTAPGAASAPSAAASGAARAGLALEGANSPEDPDCPVRQGLEAALRRNPRVQMAIAKAQGGNSGSDGVIVVWNGDWVQSQGEDGKGLAAVREAISLEVASLPSSCLDKPVRGPVLLSFGDRAGLAKVAIGGAYWRWSDLLDRAGAGSWRRPGPP